MKTIDVLCKKCNKWHFNIADNDWSVIVCLNCGSEIPHPKRRPTKRAPDAPKAGAKIKHQKDKAVKGRARR